METFIDYCKNGDIYNIKKLSLKGYDLDKGFRLACYYGHYNIVRYLCELHKNDSTYKPINIQTDNEHGFDLACENGHSDIVRFLCELHKNNPIYKPINIPNNEYGFNLACENGHNNVVNYLLRITKRGKCKPFNNYSEIIDICNKFLL